MIKTLLIHHILEQCIHKLTVGLPDVTKTKVIVLYDIDDSCVIELYIGNFYVHNDNDCKDPVDDYYYYDNAISGYGYYFDFKNCIYDLDEIDSYSIYKNHENVEYTEDTININDKADVFRFVQRFMGYSKEYIDSFIRM